MTLAQAFALFTLAGVFLLLGGSCDRAEQRLAVHFDVLDTLHAWRRCDGPVRCTSLSRQESLDIHLLPHVANRVITVLY